MIQSYKSRKQISDYLWCDQRWIQKLIDDKIIITIQCKDKIIYILAKDIFSYLSK